jgi:hypothetical protein
MSRENGGIFGKPVSPDTVTATGFWSLNAIQREKIATTWPSDLNITPALKLDFDETTTLDNRISFTRATNGTYFNSSGVLTTAGSGVPRFDHRLENDVWVNKGLLIEEARTNLALSSEEFSTTWTNLNTTETINTTTAPNGTTTADSVFETTANGSHGIEQLITLNVGTTYHTWSCFIKANGRTKGQLNFIYLSGSFQGFNVNFQLDTETLTVGAGFNGGTYLNSSITNVGNGWFRISITGYTGQSGIHSLRIFTLNDAGSSSFVGDATKGFHVWGAQLEAGAFPTSYIKTTSASVQRNADVATMTSTNFSSWYNATEGTVFTQSTIYYNIPSGVFPRIVEFGDGTFNERIIRNYSSSLPGFRYVIVDNSNTVAAIDFTTGQPNGVTSNYATAYKVNDFAGSVNGGAVGIATSGTLPTLNKVNLGTDSVNDATSINGHIAKFYYWNTRLSNNFLKDYTKT